MLTQILAEFPSQTHALTLVSDPDGVLADEAVLSALDARGFTLVDAGVPPRDPVALRYRVARARPWTVTHPLIVVTDGDLTALPYDLWRTGHHVTLALHTVFPRLAYPVVRELTATQRSRLAQAPPPPRRLGRRATQTYILRHVFDAAPPALQTPAALVAWLDAYHGHVEPAPPDLLDALLARLEEGQRFEGWPLRELLTDREAFTAFVREPWQAYVHRPQGHRMDEAGAGYLDFGADPALQDVLPILVRGGTLAPVPVPHPGRMPAWARPALLASEAERGPRRVGTLLAQVAAALEALPTDEVRWAQWQPLAWAWAELTALRYVHHAEIDADQRAAYARLRQRVDARFLPWLQERYAPLAGRTLPTPHHGHHVPAYLAYHYPPASGNRIALLILDGMALADWVLIARAWRARHPDWHMEPQLVLAQVPTITPVARQALVSGRHPADFVMLDNVLDNTLSNTLSNTASLRTSQAEPRLWARAWAREGLPREACPYIHLHPPPHPRQRQPLHPEALTSTHTRALCMVNVQIDSLMHGATLGSAEFYAALEVWLKSGEAAYVERVIAEALRQEYVVAVTSDHGHTEACGMGSPSEGVLVETRSQRARLYEDPAVAERAHADFPATVLWESDGLLPEGVSALLPRDDGAGRGAGRGAMRGALRMAFARRGRTVLSHGGASLDEVVVPLVIIRGRRDFHIA